MNNLNPENLKEKIHSTFNKNFEKYVNVDICVGVSFGTNTIAVAKKQLFSKMDIQPNYKMFFSNTFLNAHYSTQVTMGKDDHDAKIGKFDNCFKINFYSSVKTYFDLGPKVHYIYPLSCNIYLSNICGHRMYSGYENFLKDVEEFYEIESNSIRDLTGKKGFYRLELRCNMIYAVSLINQLKEYAVIDNFNYFHKQIHRKHQMLLLQQFLH